MFVRRISFMFALAFVLQSAHAQNQQLLQKLQKEKRDLSDQTTRGIRELPGAYKLRDVFDVRAEKSSWVLSTSMPADLRAPVRLKIEGLEGVNVLSMTASDKSNTPTTFTFTNNYFSDPRAIQVAAHLTFNYGKLMSMGRHATLMDGYHYVTLNQGNIFDDDSGHAGDSGSAAARTAVQFSVQIGDSQGTSQINIQYIAPDFATLRRQHPREIDQYLRPLLRQLQIESVLAADPMIAWQIFAEDLKPDPATLKEVQALLPALDSDSFQDRDRALESLQKKGLAVAIAITHLDRSQLSDQQNMLLDTAMANFQPQRGADLGKWRNDTDFLLDCLYTEDPAIRAAALDALQKKLERPIQFDVTADFETRRSSVDALRSAEK
jgi:hypothetical protein